MDDFITLRGDKDSQKTARIKLPKYRAIIINVSAFLFFGMASLISSIPELMDGNILQKKAAVFFLLVPVWIFGAHYTLRVLRGINPSARAGFWFTVKFIFIIMALYSATLSSNHLIRIIGASLLTLSILALAIAFFITMGFVNGYFGFILAFINLFFLLNHLMDGTDVSALMWFNLFGLIDLDNRIFQIVITATSFLLNFSERAFSIVDQA